MTQSLRVSSRYRVRYPRGEPYPAWEEAVVYFDTKEDLMEFIRVNLEQTPYIQAEAVWQNKSIWKKEEKE